MPFSEFGVSLVKRFESCRLTAYRDAKGLWTIGWGHFLGEGHPGIDMSKYTWTQDQADAQLSADLTTAGHAVDELLCSKPQCDAMVSLAFNIGVHAFCSSTVYACVKSGHFQSAADAFLLWSDHGLLLERRKIERSVFLYGTV